MRVLRFRVHAFHAAANTFVPLSCSHWSLRDNAFVHYTYEQSQKQCIRKTARVIDSIDIPKWRGALQ
jgi:hypothetical protein